MRKKLENKLEYMSIHYYINMLLFLPNSKIDSVLYESRGIIETDIFLDYFNSFLELINSKTSYPESSLENIDKIVSFIKQVRPDSCYIEQIVQNRNKLNNFSNIRYCYEYELRYDNYKNMINGTFEAMDANNFSLMLYFDYDFLASMFIEDEEYNKNYMPVFFMNKEYLCSVKKIINISSDLLKITEFKDRIVSLLTKNIKESKENGNAFYYFIANNYKLNEENSAVDVSYEKITQDYENFIDDCSQLLFEINKNKFLKDEDFAFFYYYLYMTHLVYSDDEITQIPRVSIYNFIDENVNNSFINEKEKNRLYDIMNIKRKYLGGKALEQYNEYLKKVNNIDLDKDSIRLFSVRSSRKEYMEFLKKPSREIIEKVNESIIYDFPNFKILLLDDSEYERQKENIFYFEYSVNAYLRIFPEVFMNEKILKRSIELLEESQLKEAKKLLKKLKKRL